jgi:signal transduction histidine kinase
MGSMDGQWQDQPGVLDTPAARPAAMPLNECIEKARQEERLALSREMHDAISGSLGALRLRLHALERSPRAAALREDLTEFGQLLQATIQATERIAHALRPGLPRGDLVPALRELAGRFERSHRVGCAFHTNQWAPDLPEEHALALYRICQEALNNAAKHARAGQLRIELHCHGEALSLEITDDGRGFDPARAAQTGRLGLRTMRERAQGCGGWLEVHSQPGCGATVMAWLPLSRRAAAAAA